MINDANLFLSWPFVHRNTLAGRPNAQLGPGQARVLQTLHAAHGLLRFDDGLVIDLRLALPEAADALAVLVDVLEVVLDRPH